MNSIEKAVKRLMSGSNPDNKNNIVGEAASMGHVVSYDPQPSGDKVVCHIDVEKLKQNGYLLPDNAEGGLAEQYRVLKRPILMNAFKKELDQIEFRNAVMVTSAVQGEGKTYTSINLALSMAMERNNTVLLIDSDVVKGSLSKLLGLDGSLGLVDLLLNPKLDPADVIISTDIPRLKILPAGRPNPHSTELLASERMMFIAQELSARYPDRIVLYDAPPLLATSQAKVLSGLAGQILLVVEAGQTPRDLVKESVAQLDKNKIIGVVLNKNKISANKAYYGGYYGASG
ncbi:MAG: XrtA-associated tyrosine autokinase [Gammaproteobacteria bacterium]|nr:XrtA-associated tyrosine autokinase [Gammaproteobacteria bacterium]